LSGGGEGGNWIRNRLEEKLQPYTEKKEDHFNASWREYLVGRSKKENN
jgi:hypothetical protein